MKIVSRDLSPKYVQLHGLQALEENTYTFPPTKLVGGTALRNLKRIEECLMNDQIGKIGIYGMGGVGKTTIMTNIHNNIKNAGTFDRVIWVTVSKESNLKKLQDDVSKELCLSLSNTEDALRRSAEIFMALNLIGKFLLILDDMWRPFSLTKIGIPEPNEENKCKIVWTTRSKKVCQGMGSERIIEVDGLTEDESWTLFKEKLGANFVLSLEIESIAKAIVKECDGLPLAIITIGAALRDEDDVRIWRNASEDLKNSSFDLEGLENDVFSCLKFSFDHLKTQIHQHCFLYCALYPEDYQIACDSLIENWIADGIFDEVEDREKGFDKGYTIINDLKDACMLENGKHGGLDISFVKMHDLLRDLAIAITKKIYLFVVKVRSKVGEFPRNENLMGDAIRVSLMYSDIKMLSCQSKCPKLSTLLLEGSRLGNIDHLFFEHMQNLRNLHQVFTAITVQLSKPSCSAVKDCWKLTEVPSVVQLTELRVLNLTGTAIRYLPDGMDGLTNLRCLGLSATKSLEMVPIGTISSFSHLEELSMVESKWKWSSNEKQKWKGSKRGRHCELEHLKKTSCRLHRLECFVILCKIWALARERQVYVSGIDCKNSVAFPESNLTELVISDLQNLSTIYMEEPTQGDNLANLKYIHIENCPKLRYVFSVGWLQTLQNLECIRVSSCKAMEEMVDDLLEWENHNTKLHVNTLANLKYIHISNCPKLKYVLSVGWFRPSKNLEEISVFGCQAMEEMICLGKKKNGVEPKEKQMTADYVISSTLFSFHSPSKDIITSRENFPERESNFHVKHRRNSMELHFLALGSISRSQDCRLKTKEKGRKKERVPTLRKIRICGEFHGNGTVFLLIAFLLLRHGGFQILSKGLWKWKRKWNGCREKPW
ncbi:disease resistance-like protein [Cinnamomum micranthum f. kanehirae]|uniref:Disease resistance-like protein n=1 Tax=Cinnamomum micranthum f. kanehirae TaxID=337451 RepID=A0A443PJ30_9MAGN|nr:disease resistance-like protein [Cinnamomum micranthum f. kanehirae]